LNTKFLTTYCNNIFFQIEMFGTILLFVTLKVTPTNLLNCFKYKCNNAKLIVNSLLNTLSSEWSCGWSVRLVVDRPGFDSLAESDKRFQKLVFTASLLDVQHSKEIMRR